MRDSKRQIADISIIAIQGIDKAAEIIGNTVLLLNLKVDHTILGDFVPFPV